MSGIVYKGLIRKGTTVIMDNRLGPNYNYSLNILANPKLDYYPISKAWSQHLTTLTQLIQQGNRQKTSTF